LKTRLLVAYGDSGVGIGAIAVSGTAGSIFAQ